MKKKGLYLELEHFNENFLRRNRVMPVNFYKGENYNQEAKVGLGNNLYNNTGLWSKEAYFNFYDKEYNSDLLNFLTILKQSKNNPEKLKILKSFFDEEYIGRYLAYIVLSQNYHISKFHNNRLVLDTWKGQVFPVITDPENSENVELNFDKSSNDLTSILNQNSEFINLKYRYLHKFLFDKDILLEEINYLEKIRDNVINVLKNDPVKINIFKDLLGKNENYKILDKNIQSLYDRKKILKNELIKKPNVKWTKNSNNFSIILNGQLPVNKIELYFKEDVPDWVFIDENYNNSYDSNEIKFYKKNNKINLDVSLYANRVNLGNAYNLFNDNIKTIITKFNLISSNRNNPSSIKITNLFLKKFILAKYEDNLIGSKSNLLNKVIFNSNKINILKSKILSGQIIVEKNLIFSDPVQIKPGTTFLLDKNVNIIFKNKVEATGKKDNKIIFKARSQEPWGTVALLGGNTAGSKLSYVEFNDGSGSFSDQFTFTSMFSIHNTSNIELKNINFKNNHFFDDMVHLIYSSNINMENLSFSHAFGDAIDIDICKNINIKNSTFINSKNDGIDLMESNVNISDVKIYNSQDKAISIGEASIAKVSNSRLEKNKFGIAVKDSSKTFISKVEFINNQSQIASYKKNLQYGAGGEAIVEYSIFKSKVNNFMSSNSKISIKNSKIIGDLKKKETKSQLMKENKILQRYEFKYF